MEHALSYEETKFIWAPHPENVWILADVQSIDETSGIVVISTDHGVETLHLKDTSIYHSSHSDEMDNLCTMNKFHEAPLIDALRKRLFNKKIYTNIGDVLISINPYEEINGLYDDPLAYFTPSDVDLNVDLPPHIFRVGNASLCAVLKSTSFSSLCEVRNQSIIISGESGAGKTEASKKIIQFLIEADKYIRQLDAGTTEQSSGSVDLNGVNISLDCPGDKIRRCIMESTAIFESFGNAKTLRNDNSSRFGKFIKLRYGSSNRLENAYAETFLLEKSRLSSVGAGERNYHVFYEMLSGTDSTLEKYILSLGEISEYKILLGEGGELAATPGAKHDATEFERLCRSLRTLGCSEDDMVCLWRVLATLLHMGNIDCYNSEDSDSPAELHFSQCAVDMEFIARTFGVSAEQLHTALTVRIIKAYRRASFSTKSLTAEEVAFNISALMKYIYGGVFKWLQNMINNAFSSCNGQSPRSKSSAFIGILDIFGFEIMEENSFEQLCINFANELLQKLFNETIFTSEQEEYAREGIIWQTLDYKDNQDVIDLISKKPNGLFHVMDAQGMLNRKTDDAALVATFNKAHLTKDGTGPYGRSRFGSNEGFIVRHFAGDVEYSVTGFIAKNNSSLQEDLMEVLRSTSKQFVKDLIEAEEEEDPDDTEEEEGGTGVLRAMKRRLSFNASRSKKLAATVTVSSRFRDQLSSLIGALHKTKTHYVKCIKPNLDKAPAAFDAPLVMHQLKCNGIMELVRIKRQGYPTHSEFSTFYRVFRVLAHGKRWPAPSECSPVMLKEYSQKIAESSLPSNMYQVGHHKLFLRDGFEEYMRQAKNEVLAEQATIIQSSYRMCVVRRSFKRIQRAVVIVQCFVRGFLARCHLRHSRNATLRLQSVVRMFIYSSAYRRQKNAAVVMSTAYRCHRNRVAYMRMRRSALLLSSFFRMARERKQYVQRTRMVIKIQCAVRCLMAVKRIKLKRRVLREQQLRMERSDALLRVRAAIVIQHFFRTIQRRGGAEKAKGKLHFVAPSKKTIVNSICKRFVANLRARIVAK